ncbi:MAG: methionine gamma-lyase [Bacteroidetes bacterium GWC2_33_15]|nr:MAG: methionine gamma-lyase [Bacteroidetes bacterium GWA2_33_15]OFX50855.1 MAG: methionine gamma-lyase [Bacteroidetes bacterium GWC2_33_15]OFX62862.1 MAG: methionine gamma-lyase [Bacteroidetes bacterium GWB2_32_14]OFX69932.1 MAG: methionine gamma-lyase [Bacteroidetes bacterium GWD2_33_33]HAN18924.1 methionine gamma-lyase [Bacteroidales bacterium]
MDTKNLGFNSKLIHAGDFHDEFGSAVTPIYQTSTFAFRNAQHGADLFAGKEKGFIYTRIGNPTIEALENKLAELENGCGGIALSSGMAAVTTVYMAFLGQGEHIVCTSAVYGPSRGVLESHFAKFGVQSTFVDSSNLKEIEDAIRPNTKLLYLETPANPTIALTDIKKASEIAHKHGIIVVVDNTFCSPYLQKPLDLGADVALHSLTKFINGHADIVGGALVAKDTAIYQKLRKTMVYMGGNMDPHQAYMVIRGVKTLSLRIDRAQENSMKVAEYLEKHPKVAWVKYPGLKSFQQYQLAKEQMKGPGAMISFELKGGYDAGVTLMNNVHLALLAVSLGGVESLIQHPASMTHAGLPKEARLQADITDGLIRYAVGIENVEDIIADLDHALAKI